MKLVRALLAFAVLFFVSAPKADAQLVHADVWQQYVDFKQTLEVRFPRGANNGGGSVFNGGLSQVNLNFLQGGGDYATLNLLKLGQFWSWNDNSSVTPMTPDLMDSDGYFTDSSAVSTHSGVVVQGITSPPLAQCPTIGIKWDGSGTMIGYGTPVSYVISGASKATSAVLTITGNDYRIGNQLSVNAVGGMTQLNGNTYTVTNVAGSAVTINVNSTGFGTFSGNGAATFSLTSPAASTDNRYFLTPSTQSAQVGVASIASSSDYPHNIRLFCSTDEAALDAGQTFGVKLKARLTEANFGAIRFFNWQQDLIGDNNCSTWDNCNKPETYFTWQAGQLRTGYLANLAGHGVTGTLTGSDYTITAPTTWPAPVGGKPADKATVHVVFANDTTQCDVPNFSCTITAGAANNVHWVAHKKTVGNALYFTCQTANVNCTSGSGTTQPILSDFAYPFTQVYYVKSVTDADNFLITTTAPPGSGGGATVTVSSISGPWVGRSVPTLNVGSTAPVQILDNGAQPLGSGGLPVSGTQNSRATLVYDSTLDKWLKQGGNSTSGYLINGVPYSVMLRLSREVGAHPWFVIPRFAQISGTDFTTSLATETKNNQPSWMIPRFEGTNENWGSTVQSQYGNALAYSYSVSTGNSGWLNGSVGDVNQWYGKAISLIGQAVNSVYGGTPSTQTRYRVVAGMQLGGFGDQTRSASTNDPRLKSTLYQSTQGGSPAYNWVTDVSPSGYFFPAFEGRNESIPLAYALYYTNAGNPSQQLINATSYETTDSSIIQIASFGTPADTIVTTAPHNLYIGEIIAINTQGGDATSGIVPQNYYVRTIPTASSLTLSSTDPYMPAAFVSGACACFTPVSFSSGGTGTSYILPESARNVPYVNIQMANARAWAQALTPGINTMQYEGGLSPDYNRQNITAKITAATASATSVLTVPVVQVQDIRSPAFQATFANSPFVGGVAPAGMNLKTLTGSDNPCSTLGNGWAIPDSTTIHISSVGAGDTITTDLNKSAGTTGTFAAALATAGLTACDAIIVDANGVNATVWMNQLRYASKSSTTLQANLTLMYGGTPFPSMFQMSGNTNTAFPSPPNASTFPSQSVWSVLEDVYQSPNPPQWKGACAFNGHSC